MPLCMPQYSALYVTRRYDAYAYAAMPKMRAAAEKDHYAAIMPR